jgi:DHA2 family multidrug resistance protein
MALFLLSMQYVLEEGASDSWFQDDLILWLTVLSALSGVLFVWRQVTYGKPIVSLRPFTNRNFVIGSFSSLIAGLGLFGGSFVLPLFMGQVLRYSPSQVGTTMVVSGLTMFIFAPLTGKIIRQLDLRVGMVLGFGLATLGSAMAVHITADWGWDQFTALQIVRSVGVTMCMVSATQMTLSTIPPEMMKDASGLATLIRNLGGAIGIALLSTVLTHQTAAHLGELSAGISTASVSAQNMLEHFTGMMQARGTAHPEGAAYKALQGIITREARVLAFGDAFAVVTCATAVAGAMSLIVGPVRTNSFRAAATEG